MEGKCDWNGGGGYAICTTDVIIIQQKYKEDILGPRTDCDSSQRAGQAQPGLRIWSRHRPKGYIPPPTGDEDGGGGQIRSDRSHWGVAGGEWHEFVAADVGVVVSALGVCVTSSACSMCVERTVSVNESVGFADCSRSRVNPAGTASRAAGRRAFPSAVESPAKIGWPQCERTKSR